jgi:hypothetical protein
MNKNKIIAIVIGAVILSGGLFYAGMKYDQSKNPPITTRGFGGNTNGRVGAGGQGGVRGGGGAGGFASGEILSKDDTGITIKLQDGGSKIILMSGTTPILKSTSGTAQDLAIGTQVIVNGSANTDGSITAQSVQIRPTASNGGR